MSYFDTRSKGRRFEEAAVNFLKKRRFQIIDQNYQIRDGEIDIIALDKEEIWHFVEVKSKKLQSLFGLPEEAVNRKKQRKIIKAAEDYLDKRGFSDVPVSLDVLAIDFNTWGRIVRIELYEGAFEERN